MHNYKHAYPYMISELPIYSDNIVPLILIYISNPLYFVDFNYPLFSCNMYFKFLRTIIYDKSQLCACKKRFNII